MITKLTAFLFNFYLVFSEFNDFVSTYVFYTHKFVTLNVYAYLVQRC